MSEKMSLVSRRNILLGLAGGVAVAGGITLQQTGSAGEFAELLNPTESGRRGIALATAEKGDWALQVGTLFTAQTGHVLKLVNVRAFPHRGVRPAELRDAPFVAAFDITSGGPLLGDQLLAVNHKEGGTFDIFMSSGNQARPLRMLAVFN